MDKYMEEKGLVDRYEVSSGRFYKQGLQNRTNWDIMDAYRTTRRDSRGSGEIGRGEKDSVIKN